MAGQSISIASAPHYRWGDDCDGWRLVTTPELAIIEERMPAGTSEQRHSHRHARQFFYVLEGELTIEIDGTTHTLRAGSGLEVPPHAPHQAVNSSGAAVRFLVISQPPSHGDRIDAPAQR